MHHSLASQPYHSLATAYGLLDLISAVDDEAAVPVAGYLAAQNFAAAGSFARGASKGCRPLWHGSLAAAKATRPRKQMEYCIVGRGCEGGIQHGKVALMYLL
jgi:hypothetical protein